MYELIYRNNKDVKLDYCDCSSYNRIPTPFTVITEDEWRDLRHKWANSYYSFHQAMNEEQLKEVFKGNPDYIGGYADVYVDYNSEYAVAEIIKNYNTKKVRAYVKIGCQHEWELIESDSISYKHKCKKCGTIVEMCTGK